MLNHEEYFHQYLNKALVYFWWHCLPTRMLHTYKYRMQRDSDKLKDSQVTAHQITIPLLINS